MIDSLFDWVNLFIEYKDYEIEDVVFKLLLIHIPTGAGGRRNAIIDPERSKSIIQLSNNFLLFILSHYQRVVNRELIYYFSSYSELTR
jgi:hypothetical protein